MLSDRQNDKVNTVNAVYHCLLCAKCWSAIYLILLNNYFKTNSLAQLNELFARADVKNNCTFYAIYQAGDLHPFCIQR